MQDIYAGEALALRIGKTSDDKHMAARPSVEISLPQRDKQLCRSWSKLGNEILRYSVALDVEHMLYVDGREHSKATQVSPCRELSSVLFIDLLTIHDHVRQAGNASSRGAWLCWVVLYDFQTCGGSRTAIARCAFLVSKKPQLDSGCTISVSATAAASAFTSDNAYLQKLNGMWLIWLLDYAIILPTIGVW